MERFRPGFFVAQCGVALKTGPQKNMIRGESYSIFGPYLLNGWTLNFGWDGNSTKYEQVELMVRESRGGLFRWFRSTWASSSSWSWWSFCEAVSWTGRSYWGILSEPVIRIHSHSQGSGPQQLDCLPYVFLEASESNCVLHHYGSIGRRHRWHASQMLLQDGQGLPWYLYTWLPLFLEIRHRTGNGAVWDFPVDKKDFTLDRHWRLETVLERDSGYPVALQGDMATERVVWAPGIP